MYIYICICLWSSIFSLLHCIWPLHKANQPTSMCRDRCVDPPLLFTLRTWSAEEMCKAQGIPRHSMAQRRLLRFNELFQGSTILRTRHQDLHMPKQAVQPMSFFPSAKLRTRIAPVGRHTQNKDGPCSERAQLLSDSSLHLVATGVELAFALAI